MSRTRSFREHTVGVALAVPTLLLALGCIPLAGARPQRPPMQFDHPNPSGPPVPLAIYIHGGGWTNGDKLSDDFYKFIKPSLLAQGVAVASVDYRLAPANRFPAQIVDVTYAVRYLRSQAKQLRIDPARFAAFGLSAGAHLASLLGTIDPAAGFDVGALKGTSSRVRAVVDLMGPTDLTAPFPPDTNYVIEPTFGAAAGTPRHPALIKASPVTYVSPGDASFLIMHGTLDEYVPYDQSVAFANKLQAAGVPVELVPVVGATHGLSSPGQSVTTKEIFEKVITFLVRELRR